MKKPIHITSVHQLMHWLAQRQIPYEIAGETKMGLPIPLIYKAGTGAPVVITAGAHAVEPSGVSAALEILENWNYTFPLYMIPMRDPLGCQSYADILSHALYQSIHFETYEELNSILQKHADQVYFQNQEFLLVRIGALLFTNLRFHPEDAGFRQNERYVNELLTKNPELLQELAGRRIICPANMPEHSETVHCYERAFTAEISSTGIISDHNRRFGSDEEPPEVRIPRQLVDDVKPGLVLDLHEGFDDTYYFFASNYSTNPETREYLDLMSAACAAEFPKGPWRLSTLLHNMPELEGQYREPAPGIIEVAEARDDVPSKVLGTNFSAYASRYCPATTIESGINNTLERRVKIHTLCAKAALDHYEKAHHGEQERAV